MSLSFASESTPLWELAELLDAFCVLLCCMYRCEQGHCVFSLCVEAREWQALSIFEAGPDNGPELPE